MNGRRTFLKTLVGAFVASAIELNMVVEDEMTAFRRNIEAVHLMLQEAVKDVWTERYRQAYREMI